MNEFLSIDDDNDDNVVGATHVDVMPVQGDFLA